ncbi:hypothetical protein [Massilia sp.]|uniref:hypothetical protein n=1 Tax=Massilia sp. TaxID=1882437 RepID=UPI00289D4E5A|nr:hypothetical protein [Massilia sp.]
MNKHTQQARRAPTKTPVTQAVVAKVQRVTAKNSGGQQAPWVSNLQRTVDAKHQPMRKATTGLKHAAPTATKGSKGSTDQKNSHPENDNHSNQRNPNHEQYYKSRGLPERPAEWDKSGDKRLDEPKPGS